MTPLDTVARNTAKTAVNGVVAQKFPGVNAASITDWVIDNASREEIFEIVKAGATGVSPRQSKLVTGQSSAAPDNDAVYFKNGLGLFS